MTSWFKNTWESLKRLFEVPDDPPEKLDVGKVEVTIVETDGTEHKLTFVGEFNCYLSIGFGGREAYFSSGWDKFQAWQRCGGETGTVHVGNGLYVPMCNIKRIKTKNCEQWVEAK